MDQVAFSPSGIWVAFVNQASNSVDLANTVTDKRVHFPLIETFGGNPSVAWTPFETNFYIAGFKSNMIVSVTIDNDGQIKPAVLQFTNDLQLSPCFGRTGNWQQWGTLMGSDSCGDVTANAWPGLDSGLRFSQKINGTNKPVCSISVRSGILRLADFYFNDPTFLSECHECVFDANGYIYLFDLPNRRLATLTRGDKLVLLTARFQKRL